MQKLTCFKKYDVRGKLGSELNENIAYRIGRAFGQHLNPKTVVVGGDVRLTSEELKSALSKGLMDAGVDVIDLGMTGTEEIYFATEYLNADGGIQITASHNPINYNGIKFVKENAKPISSDTGLSDIKLIAEEEDFKPITNRGTLTLKSNLSAYTDCLMNYITPDNIKPIKIVVNSGNGAAGHVIDEIEKRFVTCGVPVKFIKIHHEADGNFPNGIPNPLLPECRKDTSNAVIKYNADMGIAWDGDFDRCFFFDENGEFIEGAYIVGLLAEAFLKKNPKEKIVHDPRVYWNTVDIINNNSGIPIMTKSGHAFIKQRMRDEDAIYGGEMSAHHYFRDFAYCDSGMIPWLLVTELLSIKSIKLSEAVKERIDAYPTSGEINSRLENPIQAIERVKAKYEPLATKIDATDGLNYEFSSEEGEWRFNLRSSNTEPLVRLNVEAKNDKPLLARKTQEVLDLLTQQQSNIK